MNTSCQWHFVLAIHVIGYYREMSTLFCSHTAIQIKFGIIMSYSWEVQPHECLIIFTTLALPIVLNNLGHVLINKVILNFDLCCSCVQIRLYLCFLWTGAFFFSRLHLSFYIDLCPNIVYYSSSMFIQIRQQLIQKHFGVNWCNSKCALQIVCCLAKVETIM